MYLRVSATVLVVLLSTAQWTSGQTPASADQSVSVPQNPPSASPDGITFTPRPARNPFTSLGHDLETFFTSKDTAIVMGVFAPAAALASGWDSTGVRESQEDLRKSAFEPGNIGGSFAVQAGAAVGTWAFGVLTGNARSAEVGGDLIRAQLSSQVLVQGLKLVTHRTRPDGSDNGSFPSGHTASAFATATVLERHFGWKAGVPAFGFATYVGVARMAANKHNMSDVIMGAAVGIASARAVTVGVGGAKFSLGVAPTQGGAAVTFTKQ